jgi:hypothetical protein
MTPMMTPVAIGSLASIDLLCPYRHTASPTSRNNVEDGANQTPESRLGSLLP